MEEIEDPRCSGVPPAEVRGAVMVWLRSELLTSTYRWLRINTDINKNHAHVLLTTDERWCDHRVRAKLIMYSECVMVVRPGNDPVFIEYADPNMFQRLETFIACMLY